MTQVCKQFCLTPEGAPLFVGRGESFFDSHDATKVFVHSLDGAHPAMSELVNNAITFAKDCVGGKHAS